MAGLEANSAKGGEHMENENVTNRSAARRTTSIRPRLEANIQANWNRVNCLQLESGRVNGNRLESAHKCGSSGEERCW